MNKITNTAKKPLDITKCKIYGGEMLDYMVIQTKDDGSFLFRTMESGELLTDHVGQIYYSWTEDQGKPIVAIERSDDFNELDSKAQNIRKRIDEAVKNPPCGYPPTKDDIINAHKKHYRTIFGLMSEKMRMHKLHAQK